MYIDLLIKIKNGKWAKKKFLKTRFSRMDKSISDTLLRAGFVSKVEIKGRPSKRFIYLDLRGERPIGGLKFLSTPSVRRYSGYAELKKVKSGFGFSVLSTPKGIMTDTQARREKVGGQLLFSIW